MSNVWFLNENIFTDISFFIGAKHYIQNETAEYTPCANNESISYISFVLIGCVTYESFVAHNTVFLNLSYIDVIIIQKIETQFKML